MGSNGQMVKCVARVQAECLPLLISQQRWLSACLSQECARRVGQLGGAHFGFGGFRPFAACPVAVCIASPLSTHLPRAGCGYALGRHRGCINMPSSRTRTQDWSRRVSDALGCRSRSDSLPQLPRDATEQLQPRPRGRSIIEHNPTSLVQDSGPGSGYTRAI